MGSKTAILIKTNGLKREVKTHTHTHTKKKNNNNKIRYSIFFLSLKNNNNEDNRIQRSHRFMYIINTCIYMYRH